MIAAESGFDLVGEAADGEEALRLLPRLAPDVAIVDLMMPRLDGVALIQRLHPVLPQTRFLVPTNLVDPAHIRRAMEAGATGYLSKTASPQELVTVILRARSGSRVLSPEATDALVASSRHSATSSPLTARELELLALMSRGLNNQEICAELGIALPTVKFHITNILAKLDVDNRTEAVLKALKHKLVPPL